MTSKNGVRSESRENQPIQFNPRPVRAVVSFFEVWMMMSSTRMKRKNLVESTVDIFSSAQILNVETSFGTCATNFDLSSLQHPNKPNITPIGYTRFAPTLTFGRTCTISSDFQRRELRTYVFQSVDRQDSTILNLVFLLRLTIPDRIVLLCGWWSRMGTISCPII